MAWIKIPKENHPLFRAAVPKGAATKNMFGGVAGFVNDNMFGGLFARSICVKLSADDQKEALALDGATPFDPMGNGRIMKDTVLMPESVMDDTNDMKDWLKRAYDYVKTLPPKKKKPAAKKSAKPAKAKKPAKAAKAKASKKSSRKARK